ncbi:MAG: HAMP domain-containing histidine kinase [Myxococcales bacterium]|nr:HAMP domain-containing histidine kinase [Myxococcales bacterium]
MAGTPGQGTPGLDDPMAGDGGDLLISQPAFTRRVRRVGLAGMTALLVSSLVSHADDRTSGGFLALLALLALLEGLDRIRRRDRPPPPWPLVVVGIIGVMTAVIVLTGGIESAFLILFVPVGFTLGFSTPDPRVAGAPAVVIAGLACATALMLPEGDTWSWAWSPPADPTVHDALVPLMIALFSLLCSRLGRDARRELIRARRGADRAHRERLEIIAERHAGLLGLMGAVAHELKNPLTTVQSLTSHLYRKAPPDSPQQAQLDVVRAEVARLRATADGLLNAARPVSAHLMVPDALHEIAVDVVASHQTLAASKGIALRSGAGAAHAVFDRRKVVQVVSNLVLNAIEACDDGGRIAVDVGEDIDGAWLEVCDDGPGIPQNILTMLGRPGTTTKPAGSGIGIALSQSIIEQHGGRLTVTNHDAGGCRAQFWLPAAAQPAGQGVE